VEIGAESVARTGKAPRNAGIDLWPDSQASNTQRLNARPRGLASRNDQLPNSLGDQSLSDRAQCLFDEMACLGDTDLSLRGLDLIGSSG